MRIHLPVILTVGLILSGCGVEKAALKQGVSVSVVTIAQEVTAPEDIYYVGGGAAFGLLGGLANMSPAQKFKAFTVKNNIDIKKIVRETFIRKLKQTNKFSVSDSADYTIYLKIKVYGVSKASMFKDEFEPVLLINAEMLDAQKQSVWKGGHYIQPRGNPVAPVKMDLILQNPDLLRKLWEDAAAAASEKILQQF